MALDVQLGVPTCQMRRPTSRRICSADAISYRRTAPVIWSQPPVTSAHWSQNATVCFRFFCHFLDRKIKNRKFMNSFIRPKNKRRKILKNAFFWCRKRKIKRNSVGLYNNVLVIQPTHTTDKSCYWLWLAKAKTFSVNHIPTGIYLWCRCSAQ